MLKLELTNKRTTSLNKRVKKEIKYIFYPFDETSLNIIKKFNLDFIKIPSGEIDNLPLLQEIAKLRKNYFINRHVK